jgi:hypothetical protein
MQATPIAAKSPTERRNQRFKLVRCESRSIGQSVWELGPDDAARLDCSFPYNHRPALGCDKMFEFEPGSMDGMASNIDVYWVQLGMAA